MTEPTICVKCKHFLDEELIEPIAFPSICKLARIEAGWEAIDYPTGVKIRSFCCEDINHGKCPHFAKPETEVDYG